VTRISAPTLGCVDQHGIQTLRFVQSLPKRQRVPFSEKLRCNDESALDLLEKMLVFDPRKRINATECLSHEYVAPYHDPTDEPVAAEKFDWSFNDADLPVDTWKVMMYAEILGAYGLSANGIFWCADASLHRLPRGNHGPSRE
jgi:p38 MAP kinase